MSEQIRQIYLEYCTSTDIQPAQELLNVIDEKQVCCKFHGGKDSLNDLQPNEMYALCLVLSQNLDSFLELEILNQHIDGSYMSMLRNSLSTNTHLERLTMFHGSIEDEGVQQLAESLSENNPLQELNLSQNMIKDVGAEALSFMLQAECCRLEKLNLSHNLIQTDYFGGVLEGKTTLTELDLSYNNYPAESIEAILKGALHNNTLLRLNLEGMQGAANINVLVLMELIKKNATLQEIGIDIDVSSLDENLKTHLEEALLENITLLSIVSPPLEISLNDVRTAKIFKLLKANEWIATNYEKLCNNEGVDCEDHIEAYVKAKLELLAAKMTEHHSHESHESIQEESNEENSMEGEEESRITTKEQFPAVHEFKLNGDVTLPRSTAGGREQHLEVSNLYIPKSLDITPEEHHFSPTKPPGVGSDKNNTGIEERFLAMQSQIEQKLTAQFAKMLEEKVSNQLNGVSGQVNSLVSRLDSLEKKVENIEKGLNDNYLPNKKAKELQQKNEMTFAAVEGRLASLEMQVGSVDKQLRSLETYNQKDELTRRQVVEDVDYIEKIKTLETQEGIGFETLFTERMNFERMAKENFEEIFRKVEDLEGMMDQVVQDQLKEQEILSKQLLGSSVQKDKGGIEKIVDERVGELVTEKLEKFEGNFKAGIMNLRNTVYDTQNKVKDLEQCILENTELDFRGWKKKVGNQPSQPGQQITQLTQNTTITSQKTSTGPQIKSQNPLGRKVQQPPSSFSQKAKPSNELSKSVNTAPSKTTKESTIKNNFKSSLQIPLAQSQSQNQPQPAILVQDVSFVEAEDRLNMSQGDKRSRTEMSPIHRNDDPLSLGELQVSLLGSQGLKTSHNEEKSFGGKFNDNAKSQLRDNAISNLPASMRRVKEEIKRKIEDYRAAISPYKKEKENMIEESRSAHKVYTEPNLVESVVKQMRKSLRAEPVGRNIQPSDELVNMLKTRGFAFSNS